MTNGYDYSVQSANPRIILSPNNHIDGQNYYNPRQSRGHKHQHSRGSSTSSLKVPMGQTSMMRPDTPLNHLIHNCMHPSSNNTLNYLLQINTLFSNINNSNNKFSSNNSLIWLIKFILSHF